MPLSANTQDEEWKYSKLLDLILPLIDKQMYTLAREVEYNNFKG